MMLYLRVGETPQCKHTVRNALILNLKINDSSGINLLSSTKTFGKLDSHLWFEDYFCLNRSQMGYIHSICKVSILDLTQSNSNTETFTMQSLDIKSDTVKW